MEERQSSITACLQAEWNDHHHMRDQTWKLLQYSILFFLGVVGLEIKSIDKTFLVAAYAAVVVTSAFGVLIAIHHRRRQKEKFAMIVIYEKELGVYELIEPIIAKSKKGLSGWINTAMFIVAMEFGLCVVSALLLLRFIIS